MQIGKRRVLILLSVWLLATGVSFAATWEFAKPRELSLNTPTTITLKTSVSRKGTRLWLEAVPAGSIIVPDFVDVASKTVDIPIYPRDGAQSIVVRDGATDDVSTVTLPLKLNGGWRARVQLSAVENLPVLYANLATTLTVNLKAGQGTQPQSAHISLIDQSGREVYARFYSTFEMLGGLATMRAPASGLYELQAKFFEEPVTSMPRSVLRDSVQIPYGISPMDLPGLPPKEAGVTTLTVVGSIVPIEHVPTTATLIADDRFIVAVFAGTSSEFKLNKWPFAINSDITGLQADEVDVLLALQQMTGAGFVNVSVPWSAVQIGTESFRWDLLTTILKSYRSQKIRPIVNITGLSGWSGESAIQTPETRHAWVTMLRQLGRGFRKTIWGFQIWPQGELNWPSLSESHNYKALIQATWEGFILQDDKTVAPGPPLIVGGGIGFNAPFLNAVVTSETANLVNGLAFQLRPKSPVSSPEESRFPEILQEANQFATSHGIKDPKLYLSGFEWATGPGRVSEFEQANFLTRTLVYALANNFYKVTWNSLVDSVSTAGMHRAGLFRSDLSARPAAIAYNVAAFMLSGANLASTRQQGKAIVFEFNIAQQSNKWPSRLYVAWTNSPHDKEVVSLNMTLGGGYFIQDYLGQEIAPESTNNGAAHPLTGPIKVRVGYEPVFIWDAGKPPGLQNGTPKSTE